MPAWSEVSGGRPIHRKKLSRLSWGLTLLHAPLPLARWLTGVLRAVIDIPVLPVFDTGQALPLCRAVALELVRDEHS